MRRILGIVLAAALLATVLVATGCGSSSSQANGSTTAGGMTVAQILAKSDQAMSKVKSVRFMGDMTIKVSSSGSSAQAAILGQAPIILHVAGEAGDATPGKGAAKAADKTAAAVEMTLHAAGQTIPIGLRSVGGRTWLRFQGTWYAAPKSKTAAAKGASPASSSTGSLGIDPSTWAKSTTVTSEQLGGATVYHMVATADTVKIMDEIVKALDNPAFSKGAGSGAAVLNQLRSSGQLKTLEKSLAAASVQEWVDAQTFLVSKGSFDAKLHLGSGSASSGVSGLGINVTFTLGGFNQPFKVTPPAHAQPIEKLTKGLSGLSSGAGVGVGVGL